MAQLYRIIDEFDPIRLLVQVSATTDENLREHLAAQSADLEHLLATERRTLIVIDASLGPRPTATQRKMRADWINTEAERLAKTCVGVAFVVPSPLVRGALTAIFWVAQLPVPHTVHGSIEKALAWAIQQLDQAGMPVPPLLREHGAAAVAPEIADARA